jgi:predicted small lipoprotein YifL
VRAGIVLPLLVAGALAACGDDGPDATPDAYVPDADPSVPDAAPREVITATQPLLPGELVEGIMTGGADDHAVIHLTAPVAELDWNIHGHADGGTQTVYEELNVLGADYVFVPSAEADWWLLIRNSGPTSMDVEVRVELHGDMTWRWQ